MFNIPTVTNQYSNLIADKINHKTKPLGALGKLEQCATQLVTLFSQNVADKDAFKTFTPSITKPTLLVFAGDHGVAAQGVSIAPSDVTSQMVANFVSGGAAINVFCQQLGWQLEVVDCGILHPVTAPSVHDCRLGSITKPLNTEMAMSTMQVQQGFDNATQLLQQLSHNGCNTIAFGEMGIGNTTSAAALMAAMLNLPAQQCVGKGTGVSDDIVKRKITVVEQALRLHKSQLTDPITLLAALGGFEIVHITGAMLAAAEQGMAVVVDGFICSAAAMVAIAINPAVKDYLIFAHCSNEQGHRLMLDALNVTPLLQLDLRLGEGTGAALSLPLLQAALGFYNQMASFADAGVEQVVS
ncbi:MAG TPA: nicotinate-nucleotide--dimethylbenzimidazole phosphoribosyltransferase [Pseudoalteromonas prydzensis]|uniref:Nicotinate-nucleotide--dimethylbenzimidazole phosphoribosyltransferase n=1 Tax=Pseudoalteromonas prydzensis TaxID=182141 RepID=A0A7V1CX68_9GAMM|nr:nicotinate-nucleotide--dimethylbenzimidazole phosphoribosyltransferase [Pseudoalteromonas prydzensis]HEA16001.1 nicotinate-nucleotide--dimethylbenzimidazole phosphoribosyltransferase [Pseudoalteromonas prydzensis]